MVENTDLEITPYNLILLTVNKNETTTEREMRVETKEAETRNQRVNKHTSSQCRPVKGWLCTWLLAQASGIKTQSPDNTIWRSKNFFFPLSKHIFSTFLWPFSSMLSDPSPYHHSSSFPNAPRSYYNFLGTPICTDLLHKPTVCKSSYDLICISFLLRLARN